MSYISASYIVDLTEKSVDPDWITAQTGIAPTWTFHEGLRRSPNSSTGARKTSWHVRVEQTPDRDVGQAIESLLQRVRPARHVLREISREFDSWISVTIVPGRVFPSMNLSPALLSEIATFGVELSFDINGDFEPLDARAHSN